MDEDDTADFVADSMDEEDHPVSLIPVMLLWHQQDVLCYHSCKHGPALCCLTWQSALLAVLLLKSNNLQLCTCCIPHDRQSPKTMSERCVPVMPSCMC